MDLELLIKLYKYNVNKAWVLMERAFTVLTELAKYCNKNISPIIKEQFGNDNVFVPIQHPDSDMDLLLLVYEPKLDNYDDEINSAKNIRNKLINGIRLFIEEKYPLLSDVVFIDVCGKEWFEWNLKLLENGMKV